MSIQKKKKEKKTKLDSYENTQSFSFLIKYFHRQYLPFPLFKTRKPPPPSPGALFVERRQILTNQPIPKLDNLYSLIPIRETNP